MLAGNARLIIQVLCASSLTFSTPCISESRIKVKMYLNFYFHIFFTTSTLFKNVVQPISCHWSLSIPPESIKKTSGGVKWVKQNLAQCIMELLNTKMLALNF